MATDTPMQLGMVGLGRMGAGLVRRLLRDGHRCVGYDVSPDAVQALEADGAEGAVVARGARLEAREAAGGLDHGPRRRDHRRDDPGRRRGARARRRRHRRRQHLLPRRHAPCGRAPEAGHPPRRRRHERRCLGPPTRLLPDDRRGDGGRRAPLAALRIDRAGCRRRAPHAGTHRRAEPGRGGLLPLRPERGRPLREDGAQRHRVRAHGRVRRGPEHHRERRRRPARAETATPRRRRSQSPSTTGTRSTRPRSPRSGGAAASSPRGCST